MTLHSASPLHQVPTFACFAPRGIGSSLGAVGLRFEDRQMGYSIIPEHIARDPSLPHAAKAWLLALSSYADKDGKAWPARDRFLADAGVSQRHHGSIRSLLVSKGYISVQERAGLVPVYTIHREPDATITPPELSAPPATITVPAEVAPSATIASWGMQPLLPGGCTECRGRGCNHCSPKSPIEEPKEESQRRTPKIDHAAQLHAWYEEHCSAMPKCRFKPGSAAHTAALKAWKREPDAELWEERFKRAGASDTLCNGFKDWKGADFIFLLGPQNVAKLDAGTYDNRTPPPPPEWERLGFKSEQAYNNNKAYHAQQEAARIAKEQREQEAERAKFAAASVPFDDAEAEYRRNNPLPVWVFPAEPPTDDEDLPL